jgi:hypothetical protein
MLKVVLGIHNESKDNEMNEQTCWVCELLIHANNCVVLWPISHITTSAIIQILKLKSNPISMTVLSKTVIFFS